MANAYYYSFSKRHNSTAQPTGGTLIDVQLKGGCDVLAPIFILNYSGIPAFNYMSFGGRFYFVTGIKSVRQDLFEVSCEVDVLATWKSAIQATNAHVMYYNHSQSEITDKRLSTKTTKTLQSNSAVFEGLGTVSPTNPAIVIMANGKDNVGAYVVSQSDIATILNKVNVDVDDALTDIDFSDLENANDIIDWLTKFGRILGDWFSSLFGKIIYSGSAIENIRSAHILPLSKSDIGSNSATVYLGNFDTGVTGLEITDQLFTDSASVTIPWQSSDWRRNSPYHEVYLYIPYIGLVSLSASDLIGETTLTVYASIDKFSGDAIFQVKTGSGNVIGHYTTNVKTDYPIGSSNVSSARATGSMISSAVGAATAVAGIATGGAGSMIIGGATAAGLGLVNMIAPTNTSIGGSTGGAMLGLVADKAKVTCYTIFHDTTVGPHTVASIEGEPHNGVLSLSGISGYVQTASASVAGSMTDTERENINNLLNGGVYIE